LTAINAIANGGYRVRPSIVDRIIDENGDLVEKGQEGHLPSLPSDAG
jgi:membrane carboxypeptidase/penicillin-binding protein